MFLLSICFLTSFQSSASAERARFYCEESADGNPPKTVVEREIGGKLRKEDFIVWTSPFGYRVGYTPSKRCKEVSPKFNSIGAFGGYITHGKDKATNLPIICITNKEGGGCKTMLYTLNPNSARSPKEVINDLFGVNDRDRSSRTTRREECPAYVNIQRLLDKKQPFYTEVCKHRNPK